MKATLLHSILLAICAIPVTSVFGQSTPPASAPAARPEAVYFLPNEIWKLPVGTLIRDVSGKGRDAKTALTHSPKEGAEIGVRLPEPLLQRQSTYTLVIWVRPYTIPNQKRAHLYTDFIPAGPVFDMVIRDGQDIGLQSWHYEHKGNWIWGKTGQLKLNDRQWNFLALRLTNGAVGSGDATFFLNDGKAQFTFQLSDSGRSRRDAWISPGFQGHIRTMVFYHAALSDDEITAFRRAGPEIGPEFFGQKTVAGSAPKAVPVTTTPAQPTAATVAPPEWLECRESTASFRNDVIAKRTYAPSMMSILKQGYITKVVEVTPDDLFQSHTWRSESGVSTTAQFVDCSAHNVVLEKPDGKLVQVSISTLDDNSYAFAYYITRLMFIHTEHWWSSAGTSIEGELQLSQDLNHAVVRLQKRDGSVLDVRKDALSQICQQRVSEIIAREQVLRKRRADQLARAKQEEQRKIAQQNAESLINARMSQATRDKIAADAALWIYGQGARGLLYTRALSAIVHAPIALELEDDALFTKFFEAVLPSQREISIVFASTEIGTIPKIVNGEVITVEEAWERCALRYLRLSKAK